MPKIDLETAPKTMGSRYPAPFDEPCQGREALRLGDAADLTRFGVNLLTLKPGVWSSQRHWHSAEDEFVHVVSGQVVLAEDGGETLLRAGDSAGFPAGVKNGHHLRNDAAEDAVLLIVGSRDDSDHGEYPDIDMRFEPGRYSQGGRFSRKDGTPYA